MVHIFRKLEMIDNERLGTQRSVTVCLHSDPDGLKSVRFLKASQDMVELVSSIRMAPVMDTYESTSTGTSYLAL